MEREHFARLVEPHTEAMARVAAALVGPADAHGAALYAVATASADCGAQAQRPLTLWRSGDAGAHWTRLGPLATPNVRGMQVGPYGGWQCAGLRGRAADDADGHRQDGRRIPALLR